MNPVAAVDSKPSSSGISTPTNGEPIVIVSKADVEMDDAPHVKNANETTPAEATHPSAETKTPEKQIDALTEEQPKETVYECKMLEERWVEENEGDGKYELLDPGTFVPKQSAQKRSKYDHYPLLLISEYPISSKGNQEARGRKLQIQSGALKSVIRRCVGDRNPKWKCEDDDADVEYYFPWDDWLRGLNCFKDEKKRLEKKVLNEGKAQDMSNRDWEEATVCGLLINVLETYHEKTISSMEKLLPTGYVTYDTLWTLFFKHQELYSAQAGIERGYEFRKGDYVSSYTGEKYFEITCRFVGYDGNRFGWVKKSKIINSFKGKKKITSLPVYPLEYHPNKDVIKAKLIARGRKWETLRGIHLMRYGPPIKPGEVEESGKRVMVDAALYPNQCRAEMYDIHKDLDLELETRALVKVLKTGGYLLGNANGNAEESDSIDVLDAEVKNEATEDEEMSGGESEGEEKHVPLDDYHCYLATNSTAIFDFATKEWRLVDVGRLTPPTWNPNVFDLLVLPEKKKELVRGLVEQHLEESKGAVVLDDIIPGKGKGLVYVLHGPPGVGKTLTAEAVSEFTKAPLYAISAGELGSHPPKVEEELTEVFKRAARWNAVVLLDEADVFMEARSLHELKRNAAVSIFLKVLEYYKGIIFLTTNRVVSFDPAFRSRIHIALKFSDLDQAARVQVWDTFLSRVRAAGREVNISVEELAKLAERKINGREIKNAIKSAQGLAMSRKEELRINHLEQVLDIQEAFLKDLEDLEKVEGEGGPELKKRRVE
ncbi:hypothetical protein BDZ91DRAFT_716438 [Kalaharituber pfeilii]|nr:hypothetical protein BDZ91DRAFT_716438 [Kalaharituber pfeilii]